MLSVSDIKTCKINEKAPTSGNSRPKMNPASGCCLQWFIFVKNLFHQKQCKHAMNRGVAKIGGVLL